MNLVSFGFNEMEPGDDARVNQKKMSIYRKYPNIYTIFQDNNKMGQEILFSKPQHSDPVTALKQHRRRQETTGYLRFTLYTNMEVWVQIFRAPGTKRILILIYLSILIL